MATLAAVTNMPALALLGEDGKLERSTEPFRRWYQGKELLCLESPELKRVLDAEANAAVLKLDGIAVDIAAMADRSGGRHVLLTLPTEELPSLGDAGGALLDGALDESPALVWLKDLDGRYVRANARFTSLLGTDEDRLLGRTDAELPPAETVDGPRLQDRGEDAVEEPLHLEYVVPSYQGREALVVLRFPVGDRHGVPTLVCGVAAPSSESQVARSEAARLLRVERWSRLDAESVLAELLAEWNLMPDARGRSAAAVSSSDSGPASAADSREHQAAVAEARAERATAIAERDSALSANEKLTVELESAQVRLADLEQAVRDARAEGERSDAEATLAAQAAELERGLHREQERAEELERTLTLVRERLGDDAESARVEVQRARADAEAARTEVARARADANAARVDLDKARSDAEGLRTTAAGEREAAAKATAALEREVKQARDELAALERQQGADDSGALLRAAEKARIAAETALAQAVGERDDALKERAALTGELEQERKHLTALRDGSAAAEERIRELTGGLERERVRAAGLEQTQARVTELEAEIRMAITRADRADGELELAVARVERAEHDLEAAVGRAEKADGELRSATMRADKAEIELETWRGRVEQVESELKRARGRIEELETKLESGQARIVELQGEVGAGRAQITALQGELEGDRARADQLHEELRAGQTRIDELEAELAEARTSAADAESAIAALETQLEEAQAQAAAAVDAPDELTEPEAAGAEVEEAGPAIASEEPAVEPPAVQLAKLEAPDETTSAHAGPGVSWLPTAKRTLSASLARESVWRNVLKETVQVLGAEGGWDTVTAWLPEEANELGCAATWIAHRGLERFESLTLEASVRREGSLLDQALQAPHLTWLTDIDTVDDERLQTASAHGMSSALLLPVRNGTSTIGLLELLTHDAIEPDAQIALSLEAAALQLGRFGHLLSLGGKPA